MKCTKKKFCKGMLHQFNPYHALGDRKGFAPLILTNLDTLKKRIAGVRFCLTNKRSDRGIMLNFCPWCGADIMWWDDKA